MKTRFVISAVLYWIGVVSSTILGVTYLVSRQFMPYHAVAVGQDWEQLTPEVQTLILALMRVSGGGWLAVATGVAMLLIFGFYRGVSWSYWLLPLVLLVFYVPNLAATLLVTFRTPATSPWYGNAGAVVASIVAFLLTPRPYPSPIATNQLQR